MSVFYSESEQDTTQRAYINGKNERKENPMMGRQEQTARGKTSEKSGTVRVWVRVRVRVRVRVYWARIRVTGLLGYWVTGFGLLG